MKHFKGKPFKIVFKHVFIDGLNAPFHHFQPKRFPFRRSALVIFSTVVVACATHLGKLD